MNRKPFDPSDSPTLTRGVGDGGHSMAFFQSNGGLAGMKRDLTEGGVRVPFLARWPGTIAPGAVSDHISGFQDFLPTAANLAGVSLTAETDGISFLPTLIGKGKTQPQHPYLYWYLPEQGGKRSVLQWPWKLIHRNVRSAEAAVEPGAKSAESKSLIVELFNLDRDPTETRNVASESPNSSRNSKR